MNGGYILFDTSALDFTDNTKQSVILKPRADEVFKSGKLVVATLKGTPQAVAMEKVSTYYNLYGLIGGVVATIKIEADGTTITIPEAEAKKTTK